MKRIIHALQFATLCFCLLSATSTQAQETGEQLVTSKMCYACHQLDGASLGPPWRAIAARHSPRRDVMRAVLAGKIIRGGGGNWGIVPMVPNQRASEEEALIMTDWILGLTESTDRN